jgi:hypothetical protein
MTKQEALIIMGYTGIATTNFGDFHEDVERRLGYAVWTHQFASEEMTKKIQDAYKEDFLALCENVVEE